MDCSLSGSSVHGIFQVKVLEWIAISFSRGSSQPRNRTWVIPQADALPSEPCSTLTASSFRILNSSAGIPSPQLGLLIVDTVCLQISFLLLAMLCMICRILLPWPGTETVPSTVRSVESQSLSQISFFFLRTPGIRFRAHLTPVWCWYSHLNSMASARTPFPNKVTFRGPRLGFQHVCFI